MLVAAALLLVPTGVANTVERVPEFDIGPTCRALQSAEVAGAGGRNVEICRKTELRAREQLERQWTQFAAADRRRCIDLSSMGGLPSYVELITCLEIARDVRALREREDRSTVGQDPADFQRLRELDR
jgi:hypothetical protein